MLAPYANAGPTSGDTFWPPEEFAAFLLELERRGFQAFTHATGDRGIRTVLDAVETCRRTTGPADPRHQIVHVECVHPDGRGAIRRARGGGLHAAAPLRPRHRRRMARERRARSASATPGRSARSPPPAERSRSARTGTWRRWTRWSGSTRPSRAPTSRATTVGTWRRRSILRRPCAPRRSARPTRTSSSDRRGSLIAGKDADVVVLSSRSVRRPRPAGDPRHTGHAHGGGRRGRHRAD